MVDPGAAIPVVSTAIHSPADAEIAGVLGFIETYAFRACFSLEMRVGLALTFDTAVIAIDIQSNQVDTLRLSPSRRKELREALKPLRGIEK